MGSERVFDRALFLGSALSSGWLIVILTSSPGLTQVIPDDTLPLPERSQASAGTTIQITGGAVRGSNLFHSFQTFSVPAGSSAIFNNGVAITNIISRVTGTLPSTINGLIQANGTANLFLINPNGIIFGPNAQLNLGGSFLATTASGLQFGNQGNFTAINPSPPGLLTINPSALLSNQLGGGPLQSQANLATAPGRSLVLVGNPITLTGGSLRAPGGRVELAGIGGTGTVGLQVGNELQLAVPDTLALADVSLRNQAEVNVRAAGGGSIAVNAQNFSLANGSILRAGIAAQQGSVGSQAGDVTIRAVGAIRLSDTSFIANSTLGTGNSGNVTLTADSVTLLNGSQVNASTFGIGDGGTVTILARGAVLFDGEDPQQIASGTYSRVNVGAVGNSGGIFVQANSLTVTNGALLTASTLGQGNAGSVAIATQQGVRFAGVGASGTPSGAFSGVVEGATGSSGGINIIAAALTAEQGAQLDASTYGVGNSGKITIQTSGAVRLGGGVPAGVPDPGGIYSFVGERGIGNSGGISLTAGSLSMVEGAAAVATTFGRGDAGNVQIQIAGPITLDGQSGGFSTGVFSSVSPIAVGNGGEITLAADSLSVTRGAAIAASTLGRGNGANITVNIRGTALFDGVSQDNNPTSSALFSRVGPRAFGNSGNIRLTAQSLVLSNGGQLQASTRGRGNGGDIQVQADRIEISGIEPSSQLASGIFSTTTANSTGFGGDISLRSQELRLNDGGEISAQSLGTGRSGNIFLAIRDRLQGRDGQISTASAQVAGGAIDVTAGEIRLAGNSSITTSVFSGEGGGGNITLTADAIILLDDTDILAFSRDGRGGNITLTTPLFFGFRYAPAPTGTDPTTLRGNSKVDINASGRLSAGIIAVPDISKLQNTIVELPAVPVDIDTLIANSCLVPRSRPGSLIITGAGGVPTQPDDLASVPFSTYELVPLPGNPDRSSTSPSAAIAEVDGIYQLSSGEIMLGRRCRE